MGGWACECNEEGRASGVKDPKVVIIFFHGNAEVCIARLPRAVGDTTADAVRATPCIKVSAIVSFYSRDVISGSAVPESTFLPPMLGFLVGPYGGGRGK